MFHYPLDYRLDREGLLADGLVELIAEPIAAAFLWIFSSCLELAHQEVCIIHKLLVGRPH